MTNTNNTTLYVGVTTYIHARIHEHKTCHNPGSFTARYKLYKLVYYKGFETVIEAIRRYKIEMINMFNPEWLDLYERTASL